MFSALLVLASMGEASGTTFSVAYDAAPDCPTEATFEAAILARSPSARRVDTAANVHFEVTLQAARGERRLRVLLADGTSSDREIADDGCTESMQSMAIIAAMILDAQQRAAPSTAEPPAPPKPTPSTSRAESQPPEAKSERAAPHLPSPWLAVVAGAVVEGAAAPTPAFGATLGAELGFSRSGALAPSVRLSAVFAQAAVVGTNAGDARFRVVLARTQLCGLRLGDERGSVRLCGLLDGGALLAQGSNTRNPRSQTMPWFALGLGLVGSVGLGGPVSLELGAGARGMLLHDQFIFAPGAPVHEVPVFAWNSWLGLSFRL